MTVWISTAQMPPGEMVELSEPTPPASDTPPAPLPRFDPEVGWTTTTDTDGW